MTLSRGRTLKKEERFMSHTMAELAGYWRWISMHIEFADDTPVHHLYGKAPEGGVVFTPGGRLMAIATSSGREPAQTDGDRIKLFRSLLAYTGQVRLEEDGRFITEVDATWEPGWAGFQERFFSIEGDTFTVRTGKQTHPSFPGRDVWVVGVAKRASN
jgi:hypothetical protein